MTRRRRMWSTLVGGVVLVAVVAAFAVAVRGIAGWDSDGRTPTRSSHTTGASGPGADGVGTVAPAALPPGDWVRTENARPGTSSWVIPASRVAGMYQLAGYADRASVAKGQSFRLFVSSSLGDARVTAYRLGYYGGAGARLVWRSGTFPARRQARPTVAADRMVSTVWKPSLTVSTAGWPEGTYLLKLVAGGKQKYVPVTVRSSAVRGRLVLVNATTTYQAYNTWGGYSLYYGPDRSFATRSYRVSFDRPYDGDGAKQLMNFETATIQRAERLGLDLAYLTSSDLDADPAALAGARGMVSLGHDEYWSVGMRQAVTRARDSGTNIAFLGADAADWRVRFQPSRLGPQRIVAGYKSAALDPVKGQRDTTAKWRQPPRADPQNSLVGMMYECFPAQGALVVRDPSFFLFAGTGARQGSSYPGLVGTEIDRAYPITGTPAGLQVVAHSPVRCGPTKRTSSDMTYYTTSSGAGVLSTGTMLWVRGVRGTNVKYGITTRSSSFARTVTSTLLTAMAAGPMGAHHPSRSDLGPLHEPRSAGTGTGGSVGD